LHELIEIDNEIGATGSSGLYDNGQSTGASAGATEAASTPSLTLTQTDANANGDEADDVDVCHYHSSLLASTHNYIVMHMLYIVGINNDIRNTRIYRGTV
jgi:hypothetical protein